MTSTRDQQEVSITDEEGSLSYDQIWSNLIVNEELIITVAPEDVAKLKTGIKNTKARQSASSKAQGLLPISGVISFIENSSMTIQGAIEVTITLTAKGTIPILAMRIPDREI
jgi:hypothetical protein